MYRVVRYFEDLQDNNHAYNTGDTFPRVGLAVSNARINELVSSENKQHTPLIRFVDEDEIMPVPVEEPKDEVKEEPVAEGSPVALETFDEDSLSDMTTKEIIALAERRGYKITKLRKNDVIKQFLKQQR